MTGNNDNPELKEVRSVIMVDGNHNSPDYNARNSANSEDTRRIWQIALRDLQTQFERNEYDSWIKNLALVELTQESALIAAPTSYARRRLESEYGEVVSRTLSGVVGQDLHVQFTVEAPVQGQLFEQVPDPSEKRGHYMSTANGNHRPAPGPGIKSRGPYLNLNHSNPNQNRPVQNRGSSQYYGSNGYSNGSHNGFSGRTEMEQGMDNLNYAYREEVAEFDDAVTPGPNMAVGEQTSQYEAQALQFGLNPRYIFDRYIVGSSNRMAAAAGRSVAENPGNSYNPLFIYGGVGLGKTHLLHAIGHEALRLRPYLKVLYVSSEKFTNELVNGIREQRMEEFRIRYRNIDLLMIDDIQFIAGKDQTQEEFFHTFNTLVEANKQVVISSDRPPKSMLTLEDRLRSRFEGGLMSDISLPDYEMRLAILQAKAQYQPIPIPADVMEFIAHKVPSNIRELEGALIRVVAFGFLNKMPITVDLASQALNDALLNSRKKLVTKERIVETVANFYNIEMKELTGRSRSADIVLPRQVAMYILREQTDHSLVEIGQALGGRDHTTVMHGLEKIEQALDTNSQLRQQINSITQIVYNGESMK
ncbi:MAG TPA: chromosomal replication initiator protein DnaA [Chloroflexia bacterium]|nr:chromosomal replication initiator protein DnaA [Chloroflexia bacterium]